MSERVGSVSGRRIVTTSFVVLTALAAGLGYFIGSTVVPRFAASERPVAGFGPLAFEITPLSMAAYGVVAVGLGFVLFVAAIRAVSRYDDSKAT
jgi:hypothetical protein